MSKRTTNKDLEKEWKKLEQGEMKEEDPSFNSKKVMSKMKSMKNQKFSHQKL